MIDVQALEVRQLLTRREAAQILGCSMRTISRRVADGTLQTVLVSGRQRRILRSSVEALAGVDTDGDHAGRQGGQAVASEVIDLALAYGRLAASHGRLAQAAQAHLDAGWTGRRRSREELRRVIEETAGAVDAGGVPGVAADALPARVEGGRVDGPEGAQAAR